MKGQALHAIYRTFDNWSREFPVVCGPSCSNCCTDNVTMTAQEGVEILRFVIDEGLTGWFAQMLAAASAPQPADMTTNDFALACLAGREADPGDHRTSAACPFLGKNDRLCRIYPVRPFACRLFASARPCAVDRPALMPESYFEAATAVTQLIEHLGQKEYWGNMLDVLPALLDIGEFREIGLLLPPGRILQARLRTLTAKPLPGFLLSEENGARVSALLDTIFRNTVAGRTVEDILNGRFSAQATD